MVDWQKVGGWAQISHLSRPSVAADSRTYHPLSRWGEIRDIHPSSSSPPQPSPQTFQLRPRRNEPLYCREQHERLAVIRPGRGHPALLREKKKKKKKASRTIPWLFLFGHVGGPDRCIGRTFWQSRDESPNYTPYQPVHRAACTQRVFLQATTHTHTCLKTLVFFQVSPHLHFKWVRERCFFSYKMSDAGQIPTSLSRKSCSDNIISLASGLVGCVRGERGLKGEQS